MAVAAEPALATLTITNYAAHFPPSAAAAAPAGGKGKKGKGKGDAAAPAAAPEHHAITIPLHPKEASLGMRALRVAARVLLEPLDAKASRVVTCHHRRRRRCDAVASPGRA
jgi:hypothetical protein